MARRKQIPDDGQGQLIDTVPENQKEIIACAKKYKRVQIDRMTALVKEKELKDELLSLIKASGLGRLEDGKISFTANGFTITVTPRDELVTVKDTGNDE